MKWLAPLLMLLSASLAAAPLQSPVPDQPGLMAYLVKHTPSELELLFQRAAMLADNESIRSHEPVVFILHGDETFAFLNANAEKNAHLISLAKALDDKRVIDIEVCEIWMQANGVSRDELPAFIDTVPDGPALGRQLRAAGYLYF